MYVISVSRTYIHRGKRSHRKSTKKHWFVYYYDEGQKFHSKMVSFAKAMYYKKKKLRRLKYICMDCGKMFIGLVKSSKQKIDCPYCE